jgi:hypothetical protein
VGRIRLRILTGLHLRLLRLGGREKGVLVGWVCVYEN